MRSRAKAQNADVFLAVGSSLTVQPAASIPRETTKRGGSLVLVNLEPTPLSGTAEYDFRADVTEALPRIRDVIDE
jgi:NAD-dependent deacetylase